MMSLKDIEKMRPENEKKKDEAVFIARDPGTLGSNEQVKLLREIQACLFVVVDPETPEIEEWNPRPDNENLLEGLVAIFRRAGLAPRPVGVPLDEGDPT